MRHILRPVVLAVLAVVPLSAFGHGDKLELPQTEPSEIIVAHSGHTLSYNPVWLLPNWVAYELKAEELEGDAERLGRFSPDPALEKYPRAEHWHFTNSGWVRGHMIPAGDVKYSQEAMNDSFYTSNVCPMDQHFNNSIWKRLEETVRRLALQFGTVYVVTGPVMGQNVNGKVGESDVMIPDAFFKAILVPDGHSYLAIGLVMRNDPQTQGRLRDFAISVDELEKLTGRDFFCNLPMDTQAAIEGLLPLKKLGLY